MIDLEYYLGDEFYDSYEMDILTESTQNTLKMLRPKMRELLKLADEIENFADISGVELLLLVGCEVRDAKMSGIRRTAEHSMLPTERIQREDFGDIGWYPLLEDELEKDLQ